MAPSSLHTDGIEHKFVVSTIKTKNSIIKLRNVIIP